MERRLESDKLLTSFQKKRNLLLFSLPNMKTIFLSRDF